MEIGVNRHETKLLMGETSDFNVRRLYGNSYVKAPDRFSLPLALP